MYSLYIDAFSGISGNMFIGALLDLGVPESHLRSELEKLGIEGYELAITKVSKSGIGATYVDVKLLHEHGHGHDHHNEHRNLADITRIITSSALDEKIKKTSVEIFTKLGQAEAKVHDMPLEKVHFHEVGAVDTIIDIVGTVICLDYLKIDSIFVAKIRTGFGFVKCAHGKMPVPAPATAELLQCMANYKGDIEKELATPTGVAILAALAKPSADMPEDFVPEKTGYGAGSYELEIPNVVRMTLGSIVSVLHEDDMMVIEANIDDMNPQLYNHVMNKLFAVGAADVWITPIIMKKGRPACLLSVLSKASLLDEMAQALFTETSSLGFRYYEIKRKIMERYTDKIKLPYGEVHIKYGKLDGRLVNIAPEFDDCSNLSAITGKPLKMIWQDAMQAAKKYEI